MTVSPSFRRSEVNRIIDQSLEIIAEAGFCLPPFALWEPAQWIEAGSAWNQAREARLGWDVTDFGLGRFLQIGRVLFTLRNGIAGGTDKPYAEKIIVGRHGQRAPQHWHRRKIEDIINRGRGEVVLHLSPSQPGQKVYRDGLAIPVNDLVKIRLQPGESLCISPGVIHQFWGEETESGRVPLIGEVSSFCDDVSDNVFLEDIRRFAAIVEDEPARYSLCHELPEAGSLRRDEAPV